MATIRIVGAGVVGTATGVGLAAHGHEVHFVDVRTERLAELAEQGYPVCTPAQLRLGADDIVFVTVTALTGADGIDLTHLESATESIGLAIGEEDPAQSHPVIVYRCTMPPGTMRDRLIPLLESASGRAVGTGFGVVYNPEYLRAESAGRDFLEPRLVTLATLEPGDRAHQALTLLMAPFGGPLRWLPLEAAEFQKYVNNVGNAIKVSTYNWFRLYGERAGIEPHDIESAFRASLLSAENLWNPVYGTRDFGAYGGACLPKDTRALIEHAAALGLDTALLQATEEINALVDHGTQDLAAPDRAASAATAKAGPTRAESNVLSFGTRAGREVIDLDQASRTSNA
ncbi:MAG: 2-dehydropantoate 2-reductase N-terminal domain-containing protein [Actinomycetales bacterium]